MPGKVNNDGILANIQSPREDLSHPNIYTWPPLYHMGPLLPSKRLINAGPCSLCSGGRHNFWALCQPFPEVRHPSLSYSCQIKAVVLRAVLPLVQCWSHALSLPLLACVSASLELSLELLYIDTTNTVVYQEKKCILQRNWTPIALCVLFSTFVAGQEFVTPGKGF